MQRNANRSWDKSSVRRSLFLKYSKRSRTISNFDRNISALHRKECGVTATFRNLPLNSRAGNTQYSFQREHTMNLPRDRFLDLVEPAKASPPFFISGSKRLNKCHGNMSILVDGIAVIIIPLSCKHVFLRLAIQTDSIKEDTELMTRSTYPHSYGRNQQARDST